MKVMIGIPCMEEVKTDFMQSMLGLQRGEVTFAITKSSLVYDARNKIAEMALNKGYDVIVWFDSDMTFDPDTLERFLDYAGDSVEFCQIQLNYLDWTLQDGKEKYELLTSRGIPAWVMEPVRGGKLANFKDPALEEARPGESTASWGFRFLQQLPNVKMILSGMSNMEHESVQYDLMRSIQHKFHQSCMHLYLLYK